LPQTAGILTSSNPAKACTMPDPDIDERDIDDRILEAPYQGPVDVPPDKPEDIDPVPEPLRPTGRRLTLWTIVVVGLFLIVSVLFTIGEFMHTPDTAG